MPDFAKNLRFNSILPKLNALTKKQVLMTLAQEAAEHIHISEKTLYDKLAEKEDFTSSGIGDGVALPNLKIKGLQEPFMVLTTLCRAVDFRTADELPVDVVCLILSPEHEGPLHLRRLSRVSRLLKNTGLHGKISDTKDADIIQSLLLDPEGWLLAA